MNESLLILLCLKPHVRSSFAVFFFQRIVHIIHDILKNIPKDCCLSKWVVVYLLQFYTLLVYSDSLNIMWY